jgi:hypothetical protein
MFEKDLMKEVASEFNRMSDAEKANRARSLKQLLDDELKRRGVNPPKGLFKKPKK